MTPPLFDILLLGLPCPDLEIGPLDLSPEAEFLDTGREARDAAEGLS